MLLRIVRRNLRSSVSDNPAKWESLTEGFHRKGRAKRTKGYREFVFHWYPGRDGFNDIVATWGEGSDLLVVANLFYGPWDGEDTSRLEGAIEVDPRFRRRGLATALYDWGEELEGLVFHPATKHTDAAEAFWQARRKRQRF